MQELHIDNVRELEDLVIEGISGGIVQGKLDQKSSHFEVDYVIGRDIRKTDIGSIVSVLSAWCDNCDSMLTNIESQVDKVNKERGDHLRHKAALEEPAVGGRRGPRLQDGDRERRAEGEEVSQGEGTEGEEWRVVKLLEAMRGVRGVSCRAGECGDCYRLPVHVFPRLHSPYSGTLQTF